MPNHIADRRLEPRRSAASPTHIETIVTRTPIRDADGACPDASHSRPPATLVPAHLPPPVREIPDLAPEERVAELRLRIMSGMYERPEMMEAVARRMVLGSDARS